MSVLYNLFELWDGTFLVDMVQVNVPLAEKVLRPVIVYVFLVFLLRVFGKRELAQLNPFDLVVLLSLSNTVQNAIIGPDTSVTGGLLGAFTLCAFNYLVVRFLFQHRRIDQFIEGTPSTLIRAGQIDRKALAAELLTEVELVTMAHRQGFANLDEIDECVLEPGGTIFIRGKMPPARDVQHGETMARLDALSRQIESLRQSLPAR